MKIYQFKVGNLRQVSNPVSASFSDEEEYVEHFFSGNRWDVYKIEPISTPQGSPVPPYVWRHLEEKSGFVASDIIVPGIPDFLLYDGEKNTNRNTRNFKFIEAKSGKNGLQGNQIEWINKFHMFDVEVVHLRNK